MKKILFFLFLFSSFVYAQQYDFLSKNYSGITAEEFKNLISRDSLFKPDAFLENGKKYDKTFIDSIVKDKTSWKFKEFYFKDTINDKYAIVLKKLTEAEIKDQNKKMQEQFDQEKKQRKKMLGKQIENLALTDINGTTYTSEDLKGKVVVVNFWFTRCAPCIKEIPDLNKMKAEFGTENVAYFAITYNEKDVVDEFLKKHQIDFTVIPNDQKTIDLFGVSFYPTNFILDKTGKIIYVNDFFMEGMIKDMEKTIRKELKK